MPWQVFFIATSTRWPSFSAKKHFLRKQITFKCAKEENIAQHEHCKKVKADACGGFLFCYKIGSRKKRTGATAAFIQISNIYRSRHYKFISNLSECPLCFILDAKLDFSVSVSTTLFCKYGRNVRTTYNVDTRCVNAEIFSIFPKTTYLTQQQVSKRHNIHIYVSDHKRQAEQNKRKEKINTNLVYSENENR